jgi:4'-phosphopantetheinyl transferase
VARVADLQALLAPEERMRAARFRRPTDRARWVVGRALLRRVLGRYLEADPATLCFEYGHHGKPTLRAVDNRLGLFFNVSHSDDCILYAVGRQAVGVDVERLRADLDALELAKRWFAADEYRTLHALSSPLQLKAFFSAWTRKECYLKARGIGLTMGLDHIAVSVDPQAPAALLKDASDPLAPSRWSLLDLEVDPGYAAALAMEGKAEVTCLRA